MQFVSLVFFICENCPANKFILLQAFILNSRIFADDGTVLYESGNFDLNCANAEHDLELLSGYLTTNGMKLSLDKTLCMHFKSKQSRRVVNEKIMCRGKEIKQVRSCKYLGVRLDENMSMEAHVDHIISALRPWVALLYRLSRYLPRSLLLSLYHSMVQSKITYLIQVWGGCDEGLKNKVQVLQNSALRAVYGLNRRSNRAIMYENVPPGILPVRGLYDQSIHRFVFLAINNLTYTNLRFEKGTTQNAERNEFLKIPRIWRSYGERIVAYAGPKKFNELPLTIRRTVNLSTFKSGCREIYSNKIGNWLK